MKSMKKSRGIITLILVLGILAGLCYYSATIISSTGVGEDRSINLGLDLAGGVSITYQVVGDKPTDEQLDDTSISYRNVWKATVRKHRYTKSEMTVFPLRFRESAMQTRF